ncbi:MAG: Coenzyme F420 hydrogenase/dehydrogenase, beta subunit C-terminal domain [Planctomycetes bacterium]|nr:Coenzyme F420 hydrogenase/dehydrogenase, beta subunit C-terminal domain [Planctomycetota bacterium]
MRPRRDLSGVIANNLCIGCGACVHADRSLRLVFNRQKQMYEPDGPGGRDAAAVCPAVQVDFDFLQAKIFNDAPVTPLGVVRSVMLAQSTNHERNVQASSGGLIKELLLELLSRDEVDGAIVLGHFQGLRFEPKLIANPDQVDQLPGSIYHNVVFDQAIQILSENTGHFVLVAIPCQLEGIYNYIYKVRPELAERVYCTIGLLCGWQYTHHAIKAICKFKKIDFDRIEQISFRGGGPVGRLCIRTPQGECRVNRRVDLAYQVAFDRSFNIPRCHLCINHSNFLADIVVGDAWLPSTVRTATGVSLIICRSEQAAAAMRTLERKERIRTAEVTREEVVESQTRRVAFGDFSYAYAEYLKKIGEFCPEMVGPNRAAARLSPEKAVRKFHRENRIKIRLQQQGRYRYLYWRKLTLEIRPFLYRYLRWFFVRIVKIKSLLGTRKEVSREKLAGFS